MAVALRSLNFEVIEESNLNRQQMAKVILQFGKKLGKGTVGLFYYAGHGVQVEGKNYLLPLNAPINTKDEVPYESIDVNRVLDKMKSAGNSLNIMILDACRNNPFSGEGGFRDISRGLARVNAPTGSLIIYSTAPGEKAADGEGRNGLFTKHLLQNISRPNLDIALMLRDTRRGVMKESARLGYQQVPWESSSLLMPFCFAQCNELIEPLNSEKEKKGIVKPKKQKPESPKNKLIGKWRDMGRETSGEYMRFLSDNTVIMHVNSLEYPVSGTWIILSNGGIKVNLTVASTTQSLLLQFEGDYLFGMQANGKKNRLVKFL